MHPVKVSFTTQEDVEAVALRPAISPLILSLQATAYRPDGSEEVLLWTRGYQFDWQPAYWFKRATLLPKGTRLEVIATSTTPTTIATTRTTRRNPCALVMSATSRSVPW